MRVPAPAGTFACPDLFQGRREVELDAVLDGGGHRVALLLGEPDRAGVVDEVGLSVRRPPEVATRSDDPGGVAAVGLGAVVPAAEMTATAVRAIAPSIKRVEIFMDLYRRTMNLNSRFLI